MADMFSSNWTLAPRGASGLLRPPLVRLLLLPPLGLALLRRRLALQDLPVLGNVDVRRVAVLLEFRLVEGLAALGFLLYLLDLRAGGLLLDGRFHGSGELIHAEARFAFLRRPAGERRHRERYHGQPHCLLHRAPLIVQVAAACLPRRLEGNPTTLTRERPRLMCGSARPPSD